MRVGRHMQLWIEYLKKPNVKMRGLKVTAPSHPFRRRTSSVCLFRQFDEGKITPNMFLALFRSSDPNTYQADVFGLRKIMTTDRFQQLQDFLIIFFWNVGCTP